MNLKHTLSRRSFLQRSAAAAAVVGGGALAFPGVRQAMAQAGDYEIVCNFDGVRLRSEPGLSGAVVGTVNSGDVVNVTGVTVFADGYGWVPMYVQRTGASGYAAQDFFSTPDGGTGWFRGTPVHVTSDGVNLRTGPGLGNAVITVLNNGTNAVVADGPRSADGYSWYNILHDDLNGWMAADFLAEGYTNQPGPSPDPGAGQFQIGAYVRPTDSLNLRSAPSTGSSVVGVYGPSNVATVIGGPQTSGMYAWYQVEMWDDAAVGWFANPYLELARFEPTGARHQVTDGPLNVRSGAGLGSPVIATIPTGGVFVIRDASMASADGYTWAWVALESNPSVTGWVALGFSVEI